MIKRHALIGLLIMSSLGSNFSQAGIFDTIGAWWNKPSEWNAGGTVVPIWSANEYVYVVYSKGEFKASSFSIISKKVMPEKITEKHFSFISSKKHSRIPDFFSNDAAYEAFNRLMYKTFSLPDDELFVKDIYCRSFGSELVCYLLLNNYRFILKDSDFEHSNERDITELLTSTGDLLSEENFDSEQKRIFYRLAIKLNLYTGECETIAFKDLPEDIRERFSK